MSHTLEWYQLVGIVGTCVYLGCYFLTQLGKLSTPGYTYSALNIIAAACVGVSLLYDFNLASAMIQVSWIIISFVGVVLLLARRLRRRYSGKSRRPYALQRVR